MDLSAAANAPASAVAAERRLAPEDRAAQLALGMVVRGIDAVASEEGPERVAVLDDVRTTARNGGHLAPASEQEFDGVPGRRSVLALARVMCPSLVRCHSWSTWRVCVRSARPMFAASTPCAAYQANFRSRCAQQICRRRIDQKPSCVPRSLTRMPWLPNQRLSATFVPDSKVVKTVTPLVACPQRERRAWWRYQFVPSVLHRRREGVAHCLLHWRIDSGRCERLRLRARAERDVDAEHVAEQLLHLATADVAVGAEQRDEGNERGAHPAWRARWQRAARRHPAGAIHSVKSELGHVGAGPNRSPKPTNSTPC